MRKTNIFGHKINQTKILYLIVLVFIIVIAGYFAITEIKTNQLEDLQAQQLVLQNQIDDLLESSQLVTYHEISQIIQFLPNAYDQLDIIDELSFVKNLSGLALAANYQLLFDENADSPFEESLPDTVNFAKVSMSIFVDDPALILDFIDNLLEQDRIYYINQLSVSYTDDGSAMVQLTIYTFYNEVDVT